MNFLLPCSGYPEGHSDCTSLDQDIQYLKEKVEAGADFIVTQLFYDVDLFISWVGKCRKAGEFLPPSPLN
jgi:methylenetetrahydrofolate reductase (NADPH)